MRPADLALLRTPGVPAVSPDGRMAVVAVSRPDLDADAYRAQLWAVPTDGSAPARPLTSGARDCAPAFSPDGRWLAYLSAVPGGHPQVHVLPTAGGAPRRLTGAPLGTGAPVWSPDSRRLAWVARVPEEGRYGTAEGIPPEAEPPRLVTRLRHRVDGVGYTADRPSCVFVLDLPEGPPDDDDLPEPRQVTDGSGEDTDVAWSPDGGTLAFVSARHARADRDLVRDVWLVPVLGGEPRRVTRGRGECRLPAFDPAGATIYVTARPDLGPDGVDVAAGGPTLCRVPVAGGPLEPLLDPGETSRGDETPATVLTGGAALLGVERRGAVALLRVPLDGGAPETLVDGPFTVRAVAAGGGVVVATVGHDRSAGELVALTPGRRRLLTGFGAALGATGRLHRSTERTAVAADGARVHGRVTVPQGPGPHPVLLLVHGGPSTQVGWSLLDETQVYVSAGYAVVQYGLPGLPGHEEAGDRGIAEVLAFLDAALTDPALDGDRVGVAGNGPHGGFLAALLLTRTDRFAAAVVERAVTDPASVAGSGDVGREHTDAHPGADPVSPLAAVAAIRTPTLVVHGEQDERCPVEQGRRLFVALQRQGVPSALLLFPGEGHELSRSGRPRHRLARFEHLLAWWDRWLPAGSGAP